MKVKLYFPVLLLIACFSLLYSLPVLAQGPITEEEPITADGDISIQDIVHADDTIIQSSLCVGWDCIIFQEFGFDTMIIKENNLRLYFHDTSSTGSFPSNDWRITINDSFSGGASYFRIDDFSGGTVPLTILDKAHGNNVGIGVENPTEKLHVDGNVLVNGSLTESSDVNAKENFSPVNGAGVLTRLQDIPITTWNYKADSASVRHMGPMAQDFYAAFELGRDELHIAPLDANGVALAATQELYRLVQAQQAQIAALEQQNRELTARLTALESTRK